ncbi:ASCH domain-containing protein [Microbacterium plantarum]|uniref:hypothetical protein n=1 Tax=Microbacterium plantarum TaxID=1816425 RepID=UPI002B46501A|nr:hypothetical protein [Microbacterium plantarum]WRK16134.1 hypothetical protein VC184_09390 [Microbacterium plantarum]
MRILTVRQPWAWAIIHGGKDVENRVRNIAGGYRGPVAIHVAREIDTHAIATPSHIHPSFREAAKRYMAANTDPLKGSPWMGGIGHIIGVVDLLDVHSASVINGCGRIDHHCAEHPAGCRHHCSPWAMGPAPEGWYQHLVLAHPRALVEPIPYRGALGLRRLDDDTVSRIEAAIA